MTELFRNALVLLMVIAVSACSPNMESRGHVSPGDAKSQIVSGTTTRDEVLQLLGSPSTRSSFGDETWYYISSRRESFAFFKPEIADQEVLSIHFDNTGVVSRIEHTGHEAMQEEIQFTDRKTPTEGHSMTFFEQLLSNVGKFNRPDGGNARSIGSNRPGGR